VSSKKFFALRSKSAITAVEEFMRIFPISQNGCNATIATEAAIKVVLEKLIPQVCELRYTTWKIKTAIKQRLYPVIMHL
jgi:hypothetical protein